jgi:hypothetical protein
METEAFDVFSNFKLAPTLVHYLSRYVQRLKIAFSKLFTCQNGEVFPGRFFTVLHKYFFISV